MGETTKIEWCDHTFNAWLGCERISPACDDCYAAAWAKRTGQGQLWKGQRRRTTADNWRQPLKWNAAAAACGVRRRVFCCSLADVFDNAVPVEWRADLFALIRETPHLDWLLLTKRIGNARGMIEAAADWHFDHGDRNVAGWLTDWYKHGLPPANVWLGSTVINQPEADRDIPKLLATPARIRFLSIEPMLGPIKNLLAPRRAPGENVVSWLDSRRGPDGELHSQVDWVIVGGESGPGARPMHPGWVRSLRDQCAAAGVAFLFKQWGEWEIASAANGHHGSRMPDTGERYTWVGKNGKTFNPSAPKDLDCWAMAKVGKAKAGRLLDGIEHNGFPG